VSDYDYLNARIKGMHSNLLRREFYEQILANQGIAPLVDALLSSTYSRHIRLALERDKSVSGIEWGLRRNLFETFEKIRALAAPKPRLLLDIQFRRWDIQNIITIIRGKAAGLLPEEILTGVFPAGELGDVELEELAAEDNVRTVIDTLTAWDFPFAFQLRKVVRKHAGGPHFANRSQNGNPSQLDSASLESEFMRIFFAWVMDNLDVEDENHLLLKSHIRNQIDLVNVKNVLWAVSQSQTGRRSEHIVPIRGGRVTARMLSAIEKSSSLEMGFEILADTYFRRAIDRGILAFGESRRLAVMERALDIEVVETGCKMFRADPLGIGVPMGYVWRKYNEFMNLRILLRDNSFGKPEPAIREELFVVEGFSN
jgi:V/A-type H+-transporting ATPase subunit C